MDSLAVPQLEKLQAYSPGKPIEEVERELGIANAIKLASNESPIGPSPEVVKEIARLAPQIHRYPDAAAHALKRDLAAHHAVEPRELCIGNGSNELIDFLCRAFMAPTDHGISYDPSFVVYSMAFTAVGCQQTRLPLRDSVHMEVDTLLAAVRPETKLVFVSNPNNPTGTYMPREAVARLLSSLPKRVIPVLDEAYFDFAEASDYASALTMRSLHPRLTVLRTFSKAYGLASMRVGYAIASPEIISYLDRVRPPFNVGALSQAAARVALRDRAHVERGLAMNREERARVTAALEAQGLRVAPSQANFVLIELDRSSKTFADAMLREAVIVRPMPPPIDRWVRVSIGLPDENSRFLEALTRVLGSA